ncbi:MAG: hypothetical protein N3F66_07200 [Spirochaetes bacterium]|nr:hypothetical protein [Spirochaetota bacterium]
MHIIKPCPSCGIKLRFPIDSGIVKVRCRCGYSFLANPDDPGLYSDAVFDLSLRKKQKKKFLSESIIKHIIEKLYSYWYAVGNFKLLPTKDKIKIIAIFIIVLLIVCLIVYSILLSHSQPPENGIII